jgi:CBS domain-containing protein
VVALTGAIASGLWEALIGIFLRTAARAERLQTTLSESLSKRTVRMVVTPDPLIASADMSVEQFVHDRLYAHRHDLFPVVEGDRLIGVIGRQEIAGTPRSEWAGVSVGRLCTPMSEDMLVEADAPAQSALRRLMGGARGLVVVDLGRVIGVLTLQDLLERVRLQLELEGAFQPRRSP